VGIRFEQFRKSPRKLWNVTEHCVGENRVPCAVLVVNDHKLPSMQIFNRNFSDELHDDGSLSQRVVTLALCAL